MKKRKLNEGIIGRIVDKVFDNIIEKTTEKTLKTFKKDPKAQKLIKNAQESYENLINHLEKEHGGKENWKRIKSDYDKL